MACRSEGRERGGGFGEDARAREVFWWSLEFGAGLSPLTWVKMSVSTCSTGVYCERLGERVPVDGLSRSLTMRARP